MLKLVHSIEAGRNRITLTYRGYVLELTPGCSGWQVGVLSAKELTFPSFPELISSPAIKTVRSIRRRSGLIGRSFAKSVASNGCQASRCNEGLCQLSGRPYPRLRHAYSGLTASLTRPFPAVAVP